jgi:hypothetical protein
MRFFDNNTKNPGVIVDRAWELKMAATKGPILGPRRIIHIMRETFK